MEWRSWSAWAWALQVERVRNGILCFCVCMVSLFISVLYNIGDDGKSNEHVGALSPHDITPELLNGRGGQIQNESHNICPSIRTCTAPLLSCLLASLRIHVFLQKYFIGNLFRHPLMAQRTNKGVAIETVPAHTFTIQDVFLILQCNGHYIFRQHSAIRNILSMRGFHSTLHSL